MNKVFTSVILFVAISSVYCYSGGAPVEVCDSMIPNHPVDPQKSKFPYTVTVDKTEVKGGQKVAITIKGGDVQKSFKGYFLQVRNGEKAVGTFDISDSDKYSKAITCHEAKQSAATHKNSTDKKAIVLTWIAPTKIQGKLVVYATVAKDGGVFWVRQKQAEIKVIN